MVSVEVRDFGGPFFRIADAVLRSQGAGELIWLRAFSDFDGPVQVLMLDIDGTGSDLGDLTVTIVFDRIDVLMDGATITTAEFVALGRAYWDRWAAQNKSVDK
jgi:hypothetical protein